MKYQLVNSIHFAPGVGGAISHITNIVYKYYRFTIRFFVSLFPDHTAFGPFGDACRSSRNRNDQNCD